MRVVPRPLPNPYAAYLRVYEPLAAFPEGERERWAAYADARPPPAPDRLVAEHRRALAGVHQRAAAAGADRRAARRVRARGRRPAARLPGAGPAAVLDGARAVPRRAARLGAARVRAAGVAGAGRRRPRPLGRLRGRGRRCGSSPRPGSVPVPWFVAVRARPTGSTAEVPPDEPARGAPDPDVGRPAPGGPGAAHAAAAPGRAARSSSELEELGRWLEEFHARSWLELDYAGLARLLGPEVVAADTSVADVAAAVAALAAGDEEGAVAHLPHRRGPLGGRRGPRARQLARRSGARRLSTAVIRTIRG